MLIFKCALVILPSTFIVSLCFQIAKETNTLDTSLALLYIASGAIAGKIIYDRYQQIHILGSLTANPNVTSIANRIATLSASLLSVGFLIYFFLFLFKVNNLSLIALSIFICGFGTLYIWMQCILTTYLSTLFYDQHISLLRQCLANVSFLLLILMTIFGTASSLIPKGGSSGVYVCLLLTSLCSYLLAAIFCVFILSFEKDYQYFAEGFQGTDPFLDDVSSVTDATLSDIDSISGAQDDESNAMIIKGHIGHGKVS